jgi:hypothetical protein
MAETRLLIVIYEDYAADPRMWRGYDPLIFSAHRGVIVLDGYVWLMA